MRLRYLVAAAAALAAVGLAAAPGFAQGSISGPSNYGAPSGAGENESQGFAQGESDRLFRQAVTQRRTSLQKKQSTEQTFNDATATAKALQLSCDVQDVQIASANKVTGASGKPVTALTYEIACPNGMGYFVVSKNPEPPVGYSCFAIEGQHAAAAAKGEKFDEACVLPANHDLNLMATHVMRNSGTSCTVTKAAWYGQNTATHTEYTEVVCSDGRGYLLGIALPGSPMQATVIPCADAAARGMTCQMTKTTVAAASGGAASNGNPTAADFKAALVQHRVTCTLASDSDLRLIGKQNKSQRHVVEFKCPEYPSGLVALIPLGNNPNPFQTMDCAAARKVGVLCKLTSN